MPVMFEEAAHPKNLFLSYVLVHPKNEIVQENILYINCENVPAI